MHDIAKFYGYLLAQIGKLYVAQLQIGQVYRTAGTFYKSNATLPPLFTLFTYVLLVCIELVLVGVACACVACAVWWYFFFFFL